MVLTVTNSAMGSRAAEARQFSSVSPPQWIWDRERCFISNHGCCLSFPPLSNSEFKREFNENVSCRKLASTTRASHRCRSLQLEGKVWLGEKQTLYPGSNDWEILVQFLSSFLFPDRIAPIYIFPIFIQSAVISSRFVLGKLVTPSRARFFSHGLKNRWLLSRTPYKIIIFLLWTYSGTNF